MQYIAIVSQTINYVQSSGFAIYTQWLNPGYSDPARYTDHLGIFGGLSVNGATTCERSGKVNAAPPPPGPRNTGVHLRLGVLPRAYLLVLKA